MQAVFQKIWLLDQTVVGSDLAEPFAQLLTLDANLAWEDQRQSHSAHRAPADRPAGGTYYRRRAPDATSLSGWNDA